MQPVETEILWLSLTNVGLALTALAALVALAWTVVRARRESAATRPGASASRDPHVAALPALGVTLADGGEPSERATGR